MATYVLIPGAGDTASNWAAVASALEARGHDAVAVDLPCDDPSAGWSEYADAVVDAIDGRDDLVVVAHSLGGFTAMLVSSRVPVRELVFVAGMVPRPGETGSEWGRNTGCPNSAPDDPYEAFLQDVPRDVAAKALAREREQSSTPMGQALSLDEWPDVPTRYILSRDDRIFPADWTRAMVRDRLGIEPEEIDGGHCPYISRPEELATRLSCPNQPHPPPLPDESDDVGLIRTLRVPSGS